MPTTYTLPDDELHQLLAQVMERYHRPLHDAGVKVGVLMASNENSHAVSSGGYPAIACIKVVALKDRVTKGYDAELLIDLVEWGAYRDRHKRALLDHELSHLQLAKHRYTKDEFDQPKDIYFDRDDLGRPKLKLVKGDWNCGDGFKSVVERHGEWAIEFLNVRRCNAYATAAKDGIKPETQRLIDMLNENNATIEVSDSGNDDNQDHNAE